MLCQDRCRNPEAKRFAFATMFVYASHAANIVTRQSRTVVLISVNRAPILWYSKKQNAIEMSTFRSEFMALKTGMELLEGLRYKLRTMGMGIYAHAHVPVSQSLASYVKEEIKYYCIRVPLYSFKGGSRYCKDGYEPTGSKLADMLTKIQTGPVIQRLVQKVLY
jgi:hypothetical protein